MSSFICSRRHFGSISKGIMRLHRDENFYFPRTLEKIAPELNHRNASEKEVEKRISTLTNSLSRLQVMCVCYQYGDNCKNIDARIEEQLTSMKVKSVNPIDLHTIPLYKAITCALYQIEISHLEEVRQLTTEERNCLTFFETLNSELAEHIVNKLPEFNAAQWSIA